MFETTDSGSHKDSISRGNKSHFVVRGIWEHKHFSFSIQRFAYHNAAAEHLQQTRKKHSQLFAFYAFTPIFF